MIKDLRKAIIEELEIQSGILNEGFNSLIDKFTKDLADAEDEDTKKYYDLAISLTQSSLKLVKISEKYTKREVDKILEQYEALEEKEKLESAKEITQNEEVFLHILNAISLNINKNIDDFHAGKITSLQARDRMQENIWELFTQWDKNS